MKMQIITLILLFCVMVAKAEAEDGNQESKVLGYRKGFFKTIEPVTNLERLHYMCCNKIGCHSPDTCALITHGSMPCICIKTWPYY